MPLLQAESDPVLVSADIPVEAQTYNTFTIPFTVKQAAGGGPLGNLSKGGCTSKNLDVNAWVTPVTLWVDGERRDTEELCLAPDNQRSSSFSLSLSEGDHTVSIKAHPVGDIHPVGETWEDNLGTVGDQMQATVSVSRDARDPSEDSENTSVREWLRRIAAQLGTTVRMLVLGGLVGVGVFFYL